MLFLSLYVPLCVATGKRKPLIVCASLAFSGAEVQPAPAPLPGGAPGLAPAPAEQPPPRTSTNVTLRLSGITPSEFTSKEQQYDAVIAQVRPKSRP
jgi:hypothetical protein